MNPLLFTSLLTSLLLPLSASASAAELLCRVSVNAENRAKARIQLEEGAAVRIAELEGFRFWIRNRGESRYELEIYDSSVPSRSYSEGMLRAEADELKWALWTREILLETSCQIAPAARS